MARREQWREMQDLGRVLEAAKKSRFIWLHRPIYVHERAPGVLPRGFDISKFLDFEDDELPSPPDPRKLPKCPCGCDSRIARVVEAHKHLDVLIDRINGDRWVFSHLSNEGKKRFAVACWYAEKITMPFRASRKQYDFHTLGGRKRPPVKCGFGGVRAGKSTVAGEEAADECLENGGRGAAIWVVAPTREKTQIILRKLTTGDVVGRGLEKRKVTPIFPPEIIRHFPESERAARQYIVLIDETKVYLKYGSRKGGNLKGESPQFVVIDELCEIIHESNYQQILDRLVEAGGGITAATTPEPGHWAEETIFNQGQDVSEWDGECPVVHTTITALDNPWISPWNIRKLAKAKKNLQSIERDFKGKWVGVGDRLWPEFDATIHTFTGAGWHPEDYGLDDITDVVAGKFFDDTTAPHLKFVGGGDINLWPFSIPIGQIACPRGMDQSNPENWILLIQDAVIKRAKNIIEFSEFLATKAGAYSRGQKPDFFAGMAIAVDPSSAHENWNMAQIHGINESSTLAQEMRRKGFDCRPCNTTWKGKPKNPSLIDSINLVHRLLEDRVKLPQGTTAMGGRTELPRLMVHRHRAEDVKKSFETQERTARGTPKKHTNAHDRTSGPTDGVRYLAWALLYDETYGDEPADWNWS